MNRREAIITLRANVIYACESAGFDVATINLVTEALDLAIEALGRTDTDCISRQQAVEAATNTIREKFSLADWYEQLVETGLEIENLIKELPPVTPTERTGEWIEDEEQHHIERTYHCSECGFRAWGEHEKTRYCGGCGAKMKGGVE